MVQSAALLIIGNEILTGKVQEANIAVLAGALFDIGVRLKRVVVCPDELPVIAADIAKLRAEHDFLFTTGGVGPTHDDVTVRAAAAAFDRPVIRSALLVERLHARFGSACQEAHLRMADIPEGTELLFDDGLRWPTLCLENTYLLPGVPALLKLKLPAILKRIDRGVSFVSEALYIEADEGQIATLLEEVLSSHPDIELGSYPRWPGGQAVVKITVDGRDPQHVSAALAALRERLPAAQLVEAEVWERDPKSRP